MNFWNTLLVWLISSNAWSGSPQQANMTFEALKDTGVNLKVVGSICEQVARVELYREYPQSHYQIETGISYNTGAQTIGELDVVVFDKRNAEAVLVAEVKCWRDLNSGFRKALNQRKRFVETLKSRSQVNLQSTTTRAVFYQNQFVNPKMLAIAQEGARQAGFERELSLTYDQLMSLREKIITCQYQGACRRADPY